MLYNFSVKVHKSGFHEVAVLKRLAALDCGMLIGIFCYIDKKFALIYSRCREYVVTRILFYDF